MQYGHFDDALREYVIHTPTTPLPWINYLGSEDFFALVSNTAGGYCFYKDARLRRITRYRYNGSPLDADGFHVYVRMADGTVWNPGWQPTQQALDFYRCRHGLGYTVIQGKKDGISLEQAMLVPNGDNCLLLKLTVRNESAETQKVSLFPYVEFCLWDAMDDSSNFQRNFSTGEVEIEKNALYHKTEYRERRDHYAFLWSDRPYDGFDTARDAFLGVYGSPARPAAVLNGRCTGSHAHGWAPVGAMEFDLELTPGEEKQLVLGPGQTAQQCGELGAVLLHNEVAHRRAVAVRDEGRSPEQHGALLGGVIDNAAGDMGCAVENAPVGGKGTIFRSGLGGVAPAAADIVQVEGAEAAQRLRGLEQLGIDLGILGLLPEKGLHHQGVFPQRFGGLFQMGVDIFQSGRRSG